MSGELLELSIALGERDRTSTAFVADRVLDAFAEEDLEASALLRGVEGFGARHALRTDRLLSLSEDLPVVAVAVDRPAPIEAAMRRIEALPFSGPVTLAQAHAAEAAPPGSRAAHMKLTAYIGRGVRAGARPAYERTVELLRAAGVGGATVLLGVDGTLGGARRRAGFFAANVEVPAVVTAVGEAAAIDRALGELEALAPPRALSVQPVTVMKRDGELVAALPEGSVTIAGGDPLLRLTLYSSEQNHVAGRPVHVEAVERLRRAGASGATAMRGIWGYHGDHRPHGETLLGLRRRVPTVTVTIAAPDEGRRWFELLDDLTPDRGLITAELVASSRR